MLPTRLPGTIIETVLHQGVVNSQLGPMFLGGGLVLSQVSQLAGLEGYIIQNWVKRKYLSPPVQKKYNLNQLCRVFSLNFLKDSFTLEQATSLLSYINGEHAEDAKYVISDSELYAYMVDCLSLLGVPDRLDVSKMQKTVEHVTAGYLSPI
jgi:hypothetical protein